MESREDFLRRTAESIEEQLFLHKAGVPSLIDQYAKVSCRGLCQKFHAAFPRELRDKIYECVLGSKTVEVQEKELAEFAMETVVPYFRVVGTTDKLGSPHYWNPAYVGAEVLRELTGTWYRVSTFDFNARTFLIPRFLDEDRWGQGLKPRELASKVKIQIWAVCLKYSYIFEQLESLFGFKNHVSLHIEIDSIGYGEWWEDDWFRAEMSGKEIEKTMEVILPIFPILNRLKDAGFRLSVWLGSQCNITPHNAKFSSGKCLKMVEDWMQVGSVILIRKKRWLTEWESQRKEC